MSLQSLAPKNGSAREAAAAWEACYSSRYEAALRATKASVETVTSSLLLWPKLVDGVVNENIESLQCS